MGPSVFEIMFATLFVCAVAWSLWPERDEWF